MRRDTRPRQAIGRWRRRAGDIRRLLRLTGLLLRHFLGPEALAAGGARVRLRRFLESGGVTTIKIGQYLAIRRDLFSAETCAELSRLFDAVPPLPTASVRAAVAGELGRPVEAVFRAFDPEPIAAASIAQVHRARDRAGRRLAVKVQRPDVAATLSADFRVIRRVAAWADRLGLLGSLDGAALVAEIEAFTLRETDFTIEARTARRIAADPGRGVHVPRVAAALSTPRLLAMELIDAMPLARLVARAEAGERRVFETAVPGTSPAAIVAGLADAFLRQLFVTGLFHGDPHPANVLIERDGTIALVDFGIFGELGARERETMARYVEALALGRFEEAFRRYAELVRPSARTDFAAFRRDALTVLRDWHGAASDPAAPVEARLTALYQGRMFEAMRRHHVRMGRNQLLFWRALAVLDSTAHRLPVRFDLLAAIRSFFARHRPCPAARLARAAERIAAHAEARPAEAAHALARLGRLDRLPIEIGMAETERIAAVRDARTVALIVAAAALAVQAAAAGAAEAAAPLALVALAALASGLGRMAARP